MLQSRLNFWRFCDIRKRIRSKRIYSHVRWIGTSINMWFVDEIVCFGNVCRPIRWILKCWAKKTIFGVVDSILLIVAVKVICNGCTIIKWFGCCQFIVFGILKTETSFNFPRIIANAVRFLIVDVVAIGRIFMVETVRISCWYVKESFTPEILQLSGHSNLNIALQFNVFHGGIRSTVLQSKKVSYRSVKDFLAVWRRRMATKRSDERFIFDKFGRTKLPQMHRKYEFNQTHSDYHRTNSLHFIDTNFSIQFLIKLYFSTTFGWMLKKLQTNSPTASTVRLLISVAWRVEHFVFIRKLNLIICVTITLPGKCYSLQCRWSYSN